MKYQSISSLNWTNNTELKTKVFFPKDLIKLKKFLDKKSFIITGNQRSYGDMAINSKCIVSMKNFDNIINFDKKNGILEVQSGALLSNILELIIKDGWFFPVTPGTKYVSVGGMIANNIHGKKTSNNQIKFYIKEFKILLQNKKIITCSPKKNKKLFDLTIGGFGLTGVILSAKIKLKKIESSYIDQEILSYKSYSEFFSHLNTIKKYDYFVSWVQSFNYKTIKGLSYFGKHSKNLKKNKLKLNDRKLSILDFVILKIFTQNYYGVKIINFLHGVFKSLFFKRTINIYEYFYPQDRFTNWNKLYGNKGFVQIQFLVRKKDFIKIMGVIAEFFKKEKLFSAFIVAKNYNEKGSYLNFVGKGISISMDIPINKNFSKIKKFFNELFIRYNTQVNLSKDSIANKKIFEKNGKYFKFKKDLSIVNAKRTLNSIFSQRLGI